MSASRTLEPAVKLLFAIVTQDPSKDAKDSEQMLVEAKEYIKAIRELGELEEVRKSTYERLSKTLNKEIKFENDISLDARDENGSTFLICASDKGNAPIVGLLLEHKANLALPHAMTGATPLGFASQNGHKEIVHDLLEHKANPDLPNAKTGATPLGLASYNGHKEIVHDLLEHKANPDLQDAKTGATPLGLASFNGHKEIVHDLLEHKANPDLPDAKTGATPLGYASQKGHKEIVHDLLEHNATLDLPNAITGGTPLVYAASEDHTDIVSLLLRAGAKDGKTALDYALERQNLDMIILLLRYNAAIKSPELLFNFLITCDPRNPDVLFALTKLKEQQSKMRDLKVADAKVWVLREDKYQELEKYHTQLSKVSERLQVGRQLLDSAVSNTLPESLLDIICKLDAPLYRLNNSDTLFRDKKQTDKFREELAKKYEEFFPTRSWWHPFG